MAPSLMHMHRGNPNFDLQWKFLEHKIMNTMGMVYPQYWLNEIFLDGISSSFGYK
jgi:hypothetical protein